MIKRLLIGSLVVSALFIFISQIPQAAVSAQTTFFEDWTGQLPTAPQPFRDSPTGVNWDITTHSRDGYGGGITGSHNYNYLEYTFHSQHGPDCSSPAVSPGIHVMSEPPPSYPPRYEDTSFICNQHMMTSTYGPGAATVTVTPNSMIDLTVATVDNPALIKFRISTVRTSGRDYWQINIVPWDDHQQLVQGAINADLNSQPRNAIVINQSIHDQGTLPVPGQIQAYQTDQNFVVTPINGVWDPVHNWWQDYNTFLTPSFTQRDIFQIELTQNHLKVCMPDYSKCFFDTDLPQAVNWTKALVQFTHVSYNPDKYCQNDGSCGPNTLHWDEFLLAPTVPITMVKATNRSYTTNAPCATCETLPVTINFASPAPANAKLRFTALAADSGSKTNNTSSVMVSFDDGATWHPATAQPQIPNPLHSPPTELDETTFWSYFTGDPGNGGFVPEGITSVKIKGKPSQRTLWTGGNGEIWVRDVSFFSQTVSTPVPTPSGMPSITPTLTPLIGDLDEDGDVDLTDYTILISTEVFGSFGGPGDLDANGIVNVMDLNILVTNFTS